MWLLGSRLRPAHHLARTPAGLALRIAQRILALTLGILLNTISGRPARSRRLRRPLNHINPLAQNSWNPGRGDRVERVTRAVLSMLEGDGSDHAQLRLAFRYGLALHDVERLLGSV